MVIKEGCKQTEIGVIPYGWEIKELNSISKIIDSLHITPKFSENGYAMVRVTDIKSGNLNLKDTLKVNEKIYLDFTRNYKPKKGDIVLSRVGSYGVSSYVETDEPFCMGQNTVVIEPNFQNKYIYHSLNTTSVQLQIEAESYGSGYKSLSLKNIKELKIPLPKTLAEQTAIAAALSDADALITSLEKLIAKKRNIKQGAMQQLLKPKKGWEVKKLGELGECIIGLTYKPDNVKEIGTLVLRSSNVQGNILKYDNNVFVDCEISEKLTNKENDILICVRNGSRNLIGKCALIKGEAIGETFGAFMSVFRSPFNEFVFILFQSDIIKKQIDEHLGATINQITNKSLNSFEIPFPPKEEQTRISTILSNMDSELMVLEHKLEKYKKIKLGMMQELLTGKTRLV